MTLYEHCVQRRLATVPSPAQPDARLSPHCRLRLPPPCLQWLTYWVCYATLLSIETVAWGFLIW